MGKGTGAVLAAVLAFGLVGCSAPTPEPTESTVQETPVATPTQSAPAPLVAQTPEPGEPDESAFLKKFRELQAGIATQIPNATDEQLVAVGYEACEQAPDGTDSTAVSLIEGETANEGGYFVDSISIIMAARLYLCED